MDFSKTKKKKKKKKDLEELINEEEKKETDDTDNGKYIYHTNAIFVLVERVPQNTFSLFIKRDPNNG